MKKIVVAGIVQTMVLIGVISLAGCGDGQSSTPVGEASKTVTATGAATVAAQPYAGLQNRPIKALDPQRVADLLAGRGAGYAQAGELNHYPGPKHVLDMAEELKLTPEQKSATEAAFAEMDPQAKLLGKQLVDMETQLDKGFSGGAITQSALTQLTGEIATVEGKLRATHLSAHLKMKGILTPEQIAHYDTLRGYTGGGGVQATPGSQHDGMNGMHAEVTPTGTP